MKFLSRFPLPLFVWTLTLLAAGCVGVAKVSETRPRFRPVRNTVGALIGIEQAIVKAAAQERKEPQAALAEYLTAAEGAALRLRENPSDEVARDAYNFAVARVLGVVQRAGLNPWTKPLTVPAAGGDFVLSHKRDPRPFWDPTLYDFTPADEFEVKGTYVQEHTRKEGVGAPTVAVGKGPNEFAKRDFSLPKIYYGVTALLYFEGRRAVIVFEDPLATEEVTLQGKRFPMAADYTVPLAVMLAATDINSANLPRLLRPEKYADTARITRLQPYDPNKTVILVVHGLMSSPPTWTPMINHLRANAEIRKNYQFWFFSYPSGEPYPYSATILRQELDAIQKRYPLRKKIVVMGHSMGGCISRLLITDAGEKLWLELFKKPPEEVPMSPESRKLFTDALIFRHRPEVGRVIFVSAPLRGSDLATNWMGRISSSLVKSPAAFLKAGDEALKSTTFAEGDLKLKRIPNSVDTLAPNNRFVKAINTIPITPGIPYHVISGDRGKGGNKDRTKPVMSDGVVPYWSSHMDGARSEFVVPSGHPAHQHPASFPEVERILLEHVR